MEGLSASAASATSCVLTTYEGYPIFKRACSGGGSFNTSDGITYNSAGSYTGVEWQCVEWARRFTWKRWGQYWPTVVGAADMCGNRPAGVSLVSTPVPGDLIVFTPGACGSSSTYGHVAVIIDEPSSTTWRVKEQNGYQAGYHDYDRSCHKCYLHSSNNRSQFGGGTSSKLSGAVKGDVNGDGRADLVTAYTDGNAYVYPGADLSVFTSSAASFQGTLSDVRMVPGPGYLVIDVADVTGDGKADLIALHTSGTVEVWPGDATGHFGSAVGSFAGTMKLASATTGGHDPIAVADVNGDGRADFVTAYSDGNVYVYPGQADGTFGAGVASGGGTFDFALHDGAGHWPVGVADVNGDGRADLVTLHSNGSAYVYLGQADGHLSETVENFQGTMAPGFVDGSGHQVIGLGDVDGDGKADLVTVADGTAYVYRGTATGSLAGAAESFAHTLPSAQFGASPGTSADVAALLDVNGDGRADLVAAYSTGDVNVWPGRGDGTFGGAVSSFAGTFQSAFFAPKGHDLAVQSVSVRRAICSQNGCRVP